MNPFSSLPPSSSYEDLQRYLRSLEEPHAETPAYPEAHLSYARSGMSDNPSLSERQNTTLPNTRNPNQDPAYAYTAQSPQTTITSPHYGQYAANTPLYIAQPSTSTSAPITSTHLREALGHLGFTSFCYISDDVTNNRINELETTAARLIEVMHIACDVNHPYMRSIQAVRRDSYDILNAIVQIFNSRGMRKPMKNEIRAANDDARGILYAIVRTL